MCSSAKALNKENQVSSARICLSHPESDGRSSDVEVWGQIRILIPCTLIFIWSQFSSSFVYVHRFPSILLNLNSVDNDCSQNNYIIN